MESCSEFRGGEAKANKTKLFTEVNIWTVAELAFEGQYGISKSQLS